MSRSTVSTDRPNVNGTDTRVDYTIATLSINTTNIAFTNQGQVKISSSSVIVKSKILDPRAFPTAYAFSLAGSGTVGTNSAVFNGTATINNRKIEVSQ
jgi:hypothetical protein